MRREDNKKIQITGEGINNACPLYRSVHFRFYCMLSSYDFAMATKYAQFCLVGVVPHLLSPPPPPLSLSLSSSPSHPLSISFPLCLRRLLFYLLLSLVVLSTSDEMTHFIYTRLEIGRRFSHFAKCRIYVITI